MPRRATPLSAARVRLATTGQYVDGNGLRLVVKPSGARSWVFRYARDGRTREMGLGRAGSEPGAVPLAEARQRAGELHREVRAGRDVLTERNAAKAASRADAQREAIRGLTFRAVAEKYIAAHEKSWRSVVHRLQWPATLVTYVYPVMGDLPVAEVDTGHVRAVLEPIWAEKPETAGRVRGRMETVLDYARAAGWRSGENPARWRGHLDHMLPRRNKVRAVEHHAALPWREAGAFLASVRGLTGMGARALEWTMLTVARTSETLGVRWGEIDRDAAVWTVPAARMKGGREHRVPLNGPSLALLDHLAPLRLSHEPTELVFPSAQQTRPLSNMAMTAVLRRMGRGDLTVHGCRSTFRDWAAETTAYPAEVVEVALAHTVGTKVEAAYRRGDLFEKRRRLMDDWAAFCAQPYVAPLGRVVPLRAGE